MSDAEIRNSFIWKWLEEESLKAQLSISVLDAIKNNLGGVNNEELDEGSLLQKLLEMAENENGEDKSA